MTEPRSEVTPPEEFDVAAPRMDASADDELDDVLLEVEAVVVEAVVEAVVVEVVVALVVEFVAAAGLATFEVEPVVEAPVKPVKPEQLDKRAVQNNAIKIFFIFVFF